MNAVAVVATAAWTPLCMDSDEWFAWRDANRRVHVKERADRPCDDCPFGYAAEMRTLHLCNGTPMGVEVDTTPASRDHAAEYRSRSDRSAYMAIYRERRRARLNESDRIRRQVKQRDPKWVATERRRKRRWDHANLAREAERKRLFRARLRTEAAA